MNEQAPSPNPQVLNRRDVEQRSRPRALVRLGRPRPDGGVIVATGRSQAPLARLVRKPRSMPMAAMLTMKGRCGPTAPAGTKEQV
jgi:hypothetical protein